MNTPTSIPAGQIDLISDEGWVIGWAWYPEEHERQVEIEILADNKVIGTTFAYLYREDVASAGFGTGRYGFSFALPYQVLSSPRPTAISARDKETKNELYNPMLFSQPAFQDARARMDILSQDVRLLTAAMARSDTKAVANTRAAAELFKTVADFFTQLADVTLAGASPRSLRTLRDAVTETARDYRPLDFAPAAAPALSICFLANAEMPVMYRALAALHPGFAGAEAELLILDGDASADAPLLPLLASDARYLRRAHGARPAARYGEMVRAARGGIVLFLSAEAELLGPWLNELRFTFSDPQVAVAAVRAVGPDGIVEHAGAMLRDGVLQIRGPHSAEDLSLPTTVDAAGPFAFALRRETWEALNGFDGQFETVEAALADYCQRATRLGHDVLYQPRLEVMLPGPRAAESAEALQRASADAQKLKEFSAARQTA